MLDPFLTIDVVHFPSEAFTRDGFKFDPRLDRWMVSSLSKRRVTFDFGAISNLVSSLVDRLKLTLLDILSKNSFSHAYNLWNTLLHFCRSIVSGERLTVIDLPILLNYRASLNINTVYKLGALRVLLERAASLGYLVTTPEARSYLRDAVIQGNPKGVAVRIRDTAKGAFTTSELEMLNSALNDGYAKGKILLQDYALCHLLLAYGMRVIQIASMKESDLVQATASDGSKLFTMRIPRAKQRGQMARESFKIRACDRRLGELLERHLVANQRLKPKWSNLSDGDWPLFICEGKGENVGFEHHRTADEIGALVKKTFESVAPLHANAKRFRHTLAKRAHDDGADIYVIAELLDHVDIQNAKIYTEGSADIIDRLNRTMAMELAPVAQAFAGLLITRNDIEAHDAGKSKRIHDRALPGGKGADPLGNCGLHGFCSLARPIACYTCRNFRPWDDGPHEQVLSGLLQHRESQQKKGFAPRIYGLHDRTITAVARVVQLCEERRGLPGAVLV